ncbi:hypothetical protein HMPREF9104_02974 [Lentilactobacillus kisonensis F0435]|uniref:Uncharacterized protein n=1 Tax=Lentilactobacillus kisonensis F0435 TaxID=797516 RepID=H1LK28_9LACO|nr:hypothetical protein HMPREF9104_02974 [Lentilactobacillus kisonensis F0435]
MEIPGSGIFIGGAYVPAPALRSGPKNSERSKAVKSRNISSFWRNPWFWGIFPEGPYMQAFALRSGPNLCKREQPLTKIKAVTSCRCLHTDYCFTRYPSTKPPLPYQALGQRSTNIPKPCFTPKPF